MDRHVELIGFRANAYKNMGDLDGCYGILRHGHDIAPSHAGFVRRMVWVSIRRGDIARAHGWVRHHRTAFADQHDSLRAELRGVLDLE